MPHLDSSPSERVDLAITEFTEGVKSDVRRSFYQLAESLATTSSLEHDVIEAALLWGTGDDQGSYAKARTLQDAVNALYLAREKQ